MYLLYSVGIDLPPLPVLYVPKSAQDRLMMSKATRLDTFAFRANTEGPTNNTCWIIPGRLMMGPPPFGAAYARGSLQATTAILLGKRVPRF